MYLETVFSFYVLLYHFVGHSFFGLIFFGSFSDIIKRNFSLTLAKLNFYVDMSVWLFVGKQYYRLNMLLHQVFDTMLSFAARVLGGEMPDDDAATQWAFEQIYSFVVPNVREELLISSGSTPA